MCSHCEFTKLHIGIALAAGHATGVVSCWQTTDHALNVNLQSFASESCWQLTNHWITNLGRYLTKLGHCSLAAQEKTWNIKKHETHVPTESLCVKSGNWIIIRKMMDRERNTNICTSKSRPLNITTFFDESGLHSSKKMGDDNILVNT